MGTPKKSTAPGTLLMIGIIFVVFGLSASYFFSKTIEKFFWEARTKSTIQKVEEFSKQIQETDLAKWQDALVQERLNGFEKEIEKNIDDIKATKIYTTDGILAFTDLKNIKPGLKEADVPGEIQELKKLGHMIAPAGDSTKQELGKTDLLEVWTIIKNAQGEDAGFVEFYFDSSDIVAFIKEIQISIFGVITFVLAIIIILLRLAFRKQDDLILRQAHELSNVIEKSPVGIYTVSKKGIIETFNPKMVEISGIKDSSEIIGKNVFEMEAYKEAGLDKLIVEGLAGNVFEKEIEIISVQGGGKKTYRHYHGVPLKDTQEDVGRLLLMVEDITEQKILQTKAGEYAKELEARISERTKTLESKIADLEQFERVTVGREIQMIEMKQEMEKMRIKLETLGAKPNEA